MRGLKMLASIGVSSLIGGLAEIFKAIPPAQQARAQEGQKRVRTLKGARGYRLPVNHFDWQAFIENGQARPGWTYRGKRRNRERDERKAQQRLRASGKRVAGT
jgi:hypothetical protein